MVLDSQKNCKNGIEKFLYVLHPVSLPIVSILHYQGTSSATYEPMWIPHYQPKSIVQISLVYLISFCLLWDPIQETTLQFCLRVFLSVTVSQTSLVFFFRTLPRCPWQCGGVLVKYFVEFPAVEIFLICFSHD